MSFSLFPRKSRKQKIEKANCPGTPTRQIFFFLKMEIYLEEKSVLDFSNEGLFPDWYWIGGRDWEIGEEGKGARRKKES